jgi:hypothetical protein
MQTILIHDEGKTYRVSGFPDIAAAARLATVEAFDAAAGRWRRLPWRSMRAATIRRRAADRAADRAAAGEASASTAWSS